MKPAHLPWVLTGAAVAAALAVLYSFAPTQYAFYPRCMFHSLTGLECPACGSLRAVHHLLHGEVAAAFRLNPLLLVLLPFLAGAGILQLVRFTTGRQILAGLRRPVWIWLFIGTVVAFGIVRNLPFGPLVHLGP